MSFNASGWSIRRPVPTLVLFLVLMLVGIASFWQLGIDDNPNIELPYVTVRTDYAGAGPQELETQFTRKVEDAVAGLSDVEEIYSGIGDGAAYTNVRFALEADIKQSLDDVREAIDRIRADLAPYADAMTVRQMRYDDGAVVTYVIRSVNQDVNQDVNRDIEASDVEALNIRTSNVETLSELVDREISPALMAVKGVAEVRRVGGVEREISVDLDPSKLAAYGVSAAQVNEQVSAFNTNLPGGRSQVLGQEQSVRAMGKFRSRAESLQALRGLAIALPSRGDEVNAGTIPLATLATVTDGFVQPRQSATVNNQPVVSFSVFRSNGALLASVEAGVRDAIAQIEDTLPKDVQLDLIFTRATNVRDAYSASIEALILGSVLAVVVVGCFLRNWRTTLITAVALPLSIVPTFIVIHALGYSLNSMTLLALTLAVGNLVDDAIVEIENIERHIAMGKRPTQAALDSSAEVGLAVITTTATIVAVFIPVAFMGGIPGQFFKPFGVTVAVSTMFSTLVARLVTPLLAARLLKAVPPEDAEAILPASSSNASASGPYGKLLSIALRHRFLTVGVAIAIFAASLSLIPKIPTGLYGAGNTDLSNLSMTLPPGTTFERTEQMMAQVNARLLNDPTLSNEIERIYIDQRVAEADAVIRLRPEGVRSRSRQDFEQAVRERLTDIPDLRFSFDSQGASGSDKAVNIVLKGPNTERLDQTAQTLLSQMRAVPGLVEVSASTGLVKPELLIIPDAISASDQGVRLEDIANTATLMTLGDRTSDLATVEAGDQQVPVRVRLAPQFRESLADLSKLEVPSQRGTLVPLSSVASVRLGGGPSEITRYDRERQVTVSANLQAISLGQALERVYELPIMQNLPPDVEEKATGDADILNDVFKRFSLALATAILMIYAVLVLLYNSFIYPFAVMSAIPLSVGGTFVALMLTQKPIDLYALIGIVLLMGLVTKNSILLVDYALLARDRGLSLKQAAIEAGTTRLRPILMTSISTVAGMVPIALELGAGGEVRSPMAIAVIGGFSTATLLTLVVVPVCFTYVDGLRQRAANLVPYITRWFAKLMNFSFYSPIHSLPSLPLVRSNTNFTQFATASNAVASTRLAKDSYPLASDDLMPSTFAPHDTSPYNTPLYNTPPCNIPPSASLAAKQQTEQRAELIDNIPREFSDDYALNANADYAANPDPEITALYKVACIDNDPQTFESLQLYLDSTVYSLVSVSDPAIALINLVMHQPDIILLAQSTSGFDGLSICARLRKSLLFRNVPIVLLVQKVTWWQTLRAKWYGATLCIQKPLDRTQLLVKLFLLSI